MNRLEHILFTIAEEAGEVAHAASKAARFGLNDTNPKTGESNLSDIRKEFQELHAMIELLSAELGGFSPPIQVAETKEKKKRKFEVMLEYSKDKGTLSDDK